MHQRVTDGTDRDAVVAAACQEFRIFAAEQQAIGVEEADPLEHLAPDRETHAVEPAGAHGAAHFPEELRGERGEVVVELELHHRGAHDVEAEPVGCVDLRLDDVVGADDVVIEQDDPVALREQRTLGPGAPTAEVHRVAHRVDLGLRGEPFRRVVGAAVVDDEQRRRGHAVRHQAVHALLRVMELVQDRDDDGVLHGGVRITSATAGKSRATKSVSCQFR